MTQIKKYPLPYEIVIPYIENLLKNGKFLARQLVEHFDFKQGSFYTILPENFLKEQIYSFQQGGIIHQEKEIKLIDFHGSKVRFQETTSTVEEVYLYLANYLKIHGNGAVILEDVLRDKGNKFTNIENVNLCFHNNEVYFVLHRKNSLDEIRQAVIKTQHAWYFLGIFIPHVELSEYLDEIEIKKILSTVQVIITVAYDGESFIFWERTS